MSRTARRGGRATSCVHQGGDCGHIDLSAEASGGLSQLARKRYWYGSTPLAAYHYRRIQVGRSRIEWGCVPLYKVKRLTEKPHEYWVFDEGGGITERQRLFASGSKVIGVFAVQAISELPLRTTDLKTPHEHWVCGRFSATTQVSHSYARLSRHRQSTGVEAEAEVPGGQESGNTPTLQGTP